MNRDRLILKILYHAKINPILLSERTFDMEFSEYANFIFDIQKDSLISGMLPLIENDKTIGLDTTNFKIEPKGLELLEKIDDEVQRNILEVLKENQFQKSLTTSQVSKKLFIPLHHNVLESYFHVLCKKGYVDREVEKIPAIKIPLKSPYSSSASTEERFRISIKGVEYIEREYKEIPKVQIPHTVFNINGGVVNFGTIHNLSIDYVEELKAIIPEHAIREEIEKYFEEIKLIVAEKNINKGKLVSVFEKIREKAFEKGLGILTDKVIDIGWVYAMSQILQTIK